MLFDWMSFVDCEIDCVIVLLGWNVEWLIFEFLVVMMGLSVV